THLERSNVAPAGPSNSSLQLSVQLAGDAGVAGSTGVDGEGRGGELDAHPASRSVVKMRVALGMSRGGFGAPWTVPRMGRPHEIWMANYANDANSPNSRHSRSQPRGGRLSEEP